MRRTVAPFILMALLGFTGVWLSGKPTAPALAPTTVVSTTVPATTSTVASSTSSPQPQRASRGATRPRTVRASPVLDEATKQRVIAAIFSYSDWDANRMLRIAMCESGLNPWAVNGKHHGIFQIANSTLGLIEEHVALAHSMWVHRGYQPWECRG